MRMSLRTSERTPVSPFLAPRRVTVALLCALGSCALPSPGHAQVNSKVPLLGDLPVIGRLFVNRQTATTETAKKPQTVNIDGKGLTLGALVDLLMEQAHTSYTLDAELAALPTGNVKLHNVPFSTALQTILKMTHGRATYRVEDGIYAIISRPAEEATGQATPPDPNAQPGKAAEKAIEPEVKVMPPNPKDPGVIQPPDVRIRLDAVDADLYSTLKLMFTQVHANFTLDPGLRDCHVTAHLNNVSMRLALETLLKASGKPFTYRVENGVFDVRARPVKTEALDSNGKPE